MRIDVSVQVGATVDNSVAHRALPIVGHDSVGGRCNQGYQDVVYCQAGQQSDTIRTQFRALPTFVAVW